MPKPSSLVPEGRWTVAEAQAVLAMVERSGLSVQRFAAQHGLDAERIYRWRRKLSEASSQRFVEFAQPTSQHQVEVVLSSGVVVRVSESTSLEFVARLVAALERGARC